MSRPPPRPAYVALAVGLLLAVAPAEASRLSHVEAWMPLDAGNRWSYRVTKDRTYVFPDQGASKSMRLEGQDVDEVRRALGPFAGARQAFELASVNQHTDASSGETDSSKHSMIVSSRGHRVIMHTGEFAGVPVDMPGPVVLFPESPEPGIRWHVGRMRVFGGVELDLHGEIVGLEDAVVTPAGTFDNCLVIHYVGTVRGAMEMDGTQIEVESGEMQAKEWYAPGVGRVKYESTEVMTMRMPNGFRMRAEESSQRVLDAYQVGVPAAAAMR